MADFKNITARKDGGFDVDDGKLTWETGPDMDIKNFRSIRETHLPDNKRAGTVTPHPDYGGMMKSTVNHGEDK